SFIDEAMALVKQLESERTIDQWIHFANQVLERFFLPPDQDEIPLKLIRESLSHLYEQLLDAHFQEPLSRSVMVSYLKDRLNSQRNSQRFLAGQVNFCTLMPMRSIPFKVVCLLGMNDGAYPRSIPPTGFDLIAQNSQRGDRSRREDDRYLFLEALLSAQEKLYISYIGRRIQDNSERIPSVLVTELLNYCEQGFSLAPHQMITEHPLQTFSPDNYRQQDAEGRETSLFSYAHEWLPAASRMGNPPPEFMTGRLRESEGFNRSELELAELLRFYSNPCKYFFNRRLRVWFDEYSDTLEETECFAMEGLGNYQLLEEVLDTLVHNNSATALKTRLQAQGYTPRLAFGELLLDQHLKKIAPMTAHIQ
ncbi:MAG: exodeoxyribonuclease V subunit gamma, partial [Endozoicomonas sp.]